MVRPLAFLTAVCLSVSLLGEARAQPAGAVPDVVRSSSLTVAQEQELNRRLAQLEARLHALANETELRAAAVRSVAVEIFGARPDLDFDTYATLIASGARELRAYISNARGRADINPGVATLRRQAIGAAEAGHLREARTLYDQLITRTTEALEARWAREDRERASERDAARLLLARDTADSARLAFASADFLDAARRFADASTCAPEGTRERWEYAVLQGHSLRAFGDRFDQPAQLVAAAEIYEDVALPMVPRDRWPEEWAQTQMGLGSAFMRLAERGELEALPRALQAFQAALSVSTQEHDPENWSEAQLNLGRAYRLLSERGDESVLSEAIAAFEASLSARSPDIDPVAWAVAQTSLGNAWSLRAERRGEPDAFARAIQSFEAALSVLDPGANPSEWANAQVSLGVAWNTLGERGEGPNDGGDALLRAIAIYEAALDVQPRDFFPSAWARIQMNLGAALSVLGERGDNEALARAEEAFEGVLIVRTRERHPQSWALANYNLALVRRARARSDAGALPAAFQAATDALSGFQQTSDVYWMARAQRLVNELEEALGEP